MNLDAVEHAQLRDVIEDLAAIVLLVLNGIETEIKLSQQIDSLDVLQLNNLHDIVKREI